MIMKKTIILTLIFLCGAAMATAQDLIVKTDNSQVEAKVTEITSAEVRYKRFSNPDGPTYVLPVGNIRYIQYPNGEKEIFTSETSAATIPAIPLTPASEAVSAATIPATPLTPAIAVAPASKAYVVGDLYDKDGLRGLVCKVTDDGQHGLILSLDEIFLQWEAAKKSDLRLIGTSNRIDGSENMRIMEEYIVRNNLSWTDFPAFKWCRDKGEGWYFPAIDEMLQIGHNYNGGTRIHANRIARSLFNDTLVDAGGERMNRLVYYFTSTEVDEKQAYTTHMALEPPYIIEIPKSGKFIVRAVHKF